MCFDYTIFLNREPRLKSDIDKRPEHTIIKDENIDALREKYQNGLTFVVGDTHGALNPLKLLFEKIKFDPNKDHVYFVGDYNGGGNPTGLLHYISDYYQADTSVPGIHLIRGNHEREIDPLLPLENMPDIYVIRGRVMNYYIVHAGIVTECFDLINADMEKCPDQKVFAYRIDDCCTHRSKKLRQVVWSSGGLYYEAENNKLWPSQESLFKHKACIIHGHSPYCFFFEFPNLYSYGGNSLFFKDQHIFFSEDLQSFNIDSNIKGRYKYGESYRGLACVCLDVLEDIAEQNEGKLMVNAMKSSENAVFSVDHVPSRGTFYDSENIDALLGAAPKMKTITIDENNSYVVV